MYSELGDKVKLLRNRRELKQRLKEEGNETVTNCHQLKLKVQDGKYRMTDVTDIEGMFRIIESVPSKKAELIKQWLARLGESVVTKDNLLDYQYIDESKQIENK